MEKYQKVRDTMWSRHELEAAMKKVGWQAGTVPGIWVHKRTNIDINIDAKDNKGHIIWMTYALQRETPPPF